MKTIELILQFVVPDSTDVDEIEHAITNSAFRMLSGDEQLISWTVIEKPGDQRDA